MGLFTEVKVSLVLSNVELELRERILKFEWMVAAIVAECPLFSHFGMRITY